MSNVIPFPIAQVGKLQIVYYLRFADRVKIGTTTNLQHRMKIIPHDELLAIEPGGHATEHLRHTQFAASRVKGEWFQNTDEMSDHVERVRSRWGNPKASWVNWSVRHAADE